MNSLKAMGLTIKLALQSLDIEHNVPVFKLLSQKIPISNTSNFTSCGPNAIITGIRFVAELIDQLNKGGQLQLSTEQVTMLRDVKAHSHWTHHLDAVRMNGFPVYEVTFQNQARILHETALLLSAPSIIEACRFVVTV